MSIFAKPEHQLFTGANYTGIIDTTVVGVVKGLWSVIDKHTVYCLSVGCQKCLSADRLPLGF